jgi:hypothetical protein
VDIFEQLKKDLLSIDPVFWCEKYLTLEGSPFRLHGSGFRPFADIYRYIGIKALEKNSKPVIVLKGRQTGFTTMMSALEMYFMGSGNFGGDKPPIRMFHTFPQLELAAAYSKTKLQQMINASTRVEGKKGEKSISFMQNLLDKSAAANNSGHFKQFAGGNHLWIESTGIDADRLAGRTADIMVFDEVQKIPGLAIGNALKILTAAKYGAPTKGVQVFGGTPRKKGSDYHKMWLTSTQQYYHLRCEKCKDYFPLYEPESDSWETVWLYGYIVKCPKCGCEQDKRIAAEHGKWIATKEEEECKMIGFHINQLYSPFFTKEQMVAEKPGISVINTERVYRNEVIGEFFQGDASPISPDEIREMCGEDRKFRSMIEPSDNQMVIMGIDYGLRADIEQKANPEQGRNAGQSYSTAVILLVKGPQLLSIEFATKFKRNDWESKKSLIDQMMRQYSVDLAVGDIGFSQEFSTMMHNEYGMKYLVSRAHSKVNDHVKFRGDTMPKEIIFERDYYIGEMIELLKKGNIKFPLGSYEKVAWLIEHCSSMELVPSLSKYGDHSIHYAKGSTPNDGFMALLNAYIAYKFLITKGFTVNNPLLQRSFDEKKDKPMMALAYTTRWI